MSRRLGRLEFTKTGKNHIYTVYQITHIETGLQLATALRFAGKSGYWTIMPTGFSGSIVGLASMQHVHTFIDKHVYPLRLDAPHMTQTHSEYSEDGITWSRTRTDESKYFRMIEISMPFKLKVKDD